MKPMSGMESPMENLLRLMSEALCKDGYAQGHLRSTEEFTEAFQGMRADAAEQRKRPSAATSREVALAFLIATVGDVNKSMAERMQAAQTLLMHSTPG
jgi:hypothetical protein